MMNTYRKLTPEEKLLHVIEKPDDIERLRLNKKKGAGRPGISLDTLKSISLRGVNKALVGLSAVFIIVFVLYFVQEDSRMQERFKAIRTQAKDEVFDTNIKRDGIPLISKYLDDTGKNNPFDVLPEVKTEPAAELPPEPTVDFKLVGIIWSDDPQAILEDSKTAANHLLSVGDTIGDQTVSEITEDSVKLISGNVETTIK